MANESWKTKRVSDMSDDEIRQMCSATGTSAPRDNTFPADPWCCRTCERIAKEAGDDTLAAALDLDR